MCDVTPPGVHAEARGVNERGEIVGVTGSPERDRALHWSGHRRVARDLGDLGGSTTGVEDINDRGVAVGYSLTGDLTPDTGYPVARAVAFLPR